ncbi:hypothetical protein COO91_04608 [Nostoc flagelliforme CCNUN1]|uniref:Tetratricopeptide n=1 Tax=Nostoc flagelliforme CCNUN1 TaxID=2038116 RepID=A0A2K8ST60_9NOSO|nr:hypothetical protein COO91_04608 [Nostoc flagelliforme CCNUN1]
MKSETRNVLLQAYADTHNYKKSLDLLQKSIPFSTSRQKPES